MNDALRYITDHNRNERDTHAIVILMGQCKGQGKLTKDTYIALEMILYSRIPHRIVTKLLQSKRIAKLVIE